MNLQELIRIQREFDSQHGWTPDRENKNEVLSFLTKDLVGLFGEVGEFANLVKKIELVAHDEHALGKAFQDLRPSLEEELVDSLIYLLRFASHLNVDLEAGYQRKLEVNRRRFREFERNGVDE